jgi:hypothetical protein
MRPWRRGKMRALFLIALFLIVSHLTASAEPEKAHYRVKASGGTTKAALGDSLELSLDHGSIVAIDTSCDVDMVNDASGNPKCPHPPREIAQFEPSSIVRVTMGMVTAFVSVSWTSDGQQATLTFEPSPKDLPLIVDFFESVTGKKAVDASTLVTDRPRVYLRSQSFGNQWNAARNQSMEMAKDFGKLCPAVVITINEQKADFTIDLNHIERGAVVRDNQIQVYNKDGDLISGKEGGSIMGGVKNACILITSEWAAHHQ